MAILLPCLFVISCRRHGNDDVAREEAKKSLLQVISRISNGSRSLFLPSDLIPFCKTQGTILPSPEAARTACSDPRSFHALNRARRFDKVFIPTGYEYASLRDKLLESPLWILSEILPEGYVFRPAGYKAWQPPEDKEAEALQPDPEKRSLWMSTVAANLIAIGRNDEALALLQKPSDSKLAESFRLATLASLEAKRGNWYGASELCRTSLKLAPSSRGSRITLIRSLEESGKVDEAMKEARFLVNSETDAETLFLQARAANAGGDHESEIAALRRLVVTGRKNGQPVGASLLYLGQALGRDGRRGEALRVLDEALDAPELTQEQKNLIRQLREHLAPEKEE